MQQSSECDSSGRLCMDSDAITSTYSGKCMFMCAHMCISVCTCYVNDFLLAGFPQCIVAIAYNQAEHRSGKPAVLDSLRCTRHVFITLPLKYPLNSNVIKKGRLWPPPPKTVHTNRRQPFRKKTCRIHTSHFHLQKSSFFIEMKMSFLSLSKSARQK